MTRAGAVIWGALVCLGGAGEKARAQAPGQVHPRWEIPGFDFSRNGAWRKQGRAVAAYRAGLIARRQFGALNAPLAGRAAPATAAVQGVFKVPAIIFTYADTPTPAFDSAAYNAVLFGTTPPLGRPYTYHSFYDEMSNGLLNIQGATYGYVALDSNELTYVGTPPCVGNPYGTTNCNGLFGADAFTRMRRALTEALTKLDISVDWTQYDWDGDGYVDLVVFIQPALDGACGGPSNNHLWSHRDSLVPEFTTHSVSPSGVHEKVHDYILQSGVGGQQPVGDFPCDSTQIMPIGIVAHETGHAFDLPDLYDTGLFTSSEGIGEWGLMGEGSYATPSSPARMDAWSLSRLGWVTIAPLGAAATYSFGAAPVSDTAFYVAVQGSNPRGEYYLIENRQATQSDTALIRRHCEVSLLPANCPGGLLIWHVDPPQIAAHDLSHGNAVNVGPIHGLALMQADGRGDLDAGRNRGDAGDLYPGQTGNTAFSLDARPFPTKNSDGSFAGFTITSIQQVVAGSTMSFTLSFGAPMPATQAVVDQLLTGSGLTPADQNYLDVGGNRNSLFDVGDFLAWVIATGAP